MSTPVRRAAVRRWVDELALGARLARAGGRDSWTRALMTAVGVGLGVALLLVAASIPAMLQVRQERGNNRADTPVGDTLPRGDNTMLSAPADTSFADTGIRGRVLWPEGARAPLPPGVAKLPAPGELVLSPALYDLLLSPEGELLRPRFDHPVAGTIGAAGLAGPNEYAYYLVSERPLDEPGTGLTYRLDHYGANDRNDGLPPVLMLLVVIVFVVLLLPVVIFVAAAMRFGGEQRDRRLAALRLVGVDTAMARRIAAGDALLGSVLGVAFGLLFFAAGRRLVELVTLWDISVFATDVRPGLPLAAVIVLGVPVTAIGAALLALRRVIVEPLGVVRRSGRTRGRLWWRLVLPAVGLVVLYPLFGGIEPNGTFSESRVAGGVVLLLVGVAALLPWLIEAVVRRFGGGGPVSWQLAVRRLQLASGTSARLVNGVAVAVAGGIALQMLFTGVQAAYTEQTGQDPRRAQVVVGSYQSAGPTAGALAERFRGTAGVRSAFAVSDTWVTDAAEETYSLLLGDCVALRQVAQVDGCARGDVFILDPAPPGLKPGAALRLHLRNGITAWSVPASARTVPSVADPSGQFRSGVFVVDPPVPPNTLQQVRTEVYLQVDPGRADAVEQVRNTAAGVSPLLTVNSLTATTQPRKFVNIQRGLLIGMVATLLLIGASLLVTVLEQLRERRKLLAVLVAFGTRRVTLVLSVLWQTALPVLLGLVLAVATGTGLGVALLSMVREPVAFDWGGMAAIVGVATAMVLAVTAMSMPALWRLMRPDGLHTE